MRLVRGRLPDGSIVLARVEGEQCVPVATESFHPAADVVRESIASGADLAASGPSRPLEDLEALAPVANPSKILCAGLNYAAHAAESGFEPPSAPVFFSKPPSSLLAHRGEIRFRASDTTQVDYEAELAVVIGRTCRDVSTEDALGAVLGYTVANDVSARDAQFADGQWVRGKSFDTFCPLGPYLLTPEDVPDLQSLGIRCLVNGRALQDDTTAHMIHPVANLISYLSRFMTLVPGDLILTGTPDGVGFARTPPVFLSDGDEVTVEIDEMGRLSNPICQVG